MRVEQFKNENCGKPGTGGQDLPKAGFNLKSVFDMTDEEIKERARPISEAAKKRAWDNGSYISYRNELCITEDLIIHEFANGKIELVSVSADNGETKLIRTLVNR